MMTYKLDKLKHFQDGWIDKVVAALVADKSINDGGKQVALDDVAVVELIFQSHDLPHEPQRIWKLIDPFVNWIKRFFII